MSNEIHVSIVPRVVLLALIYFLLFLMIFIFIRNLLPSDIIFYQGIKVILSLTFVICVLSFILTKKKSISDALFEQIILASFLGSVSAYSFHITLPSLLDRSISLYIIGTTYERGVEDIGQYRQDFYDGFIVKNQAVEKRLSEQIITGNISCNSGSCVLTSKGKRLYKFNCFLVKLFNVDSRYVVPRIAGSLK